MYKNMYIKMYLNFVFMDTILISTGEFRSKQREYFEAVDKGQNVIVKRGRRFYAIVPTDISLTIKTETFNRFNNLKNV